LGKALSKNDSNNNKGDPKTLLIMANEKGVLKLLSEKVDIYLGAKSTHTLVHQC
jgi:hypothetical protein